jgi:crossover junction endodeoxyribonuclease RuvC
MIVFGIDPGSTVTGYAVVSRTAGRYALHEAGTIRTSTSDPVADRLARIFRELQDAIARTRPDAVAIEAIFRHRSSESALKLGQARGVALLAAAQALVPVAEYYPNVVKLSVAGHGGADKAQVGRMVTRLLGIGDALSSDASDACAIAITHVVRHGLDARVAMVAMKGARR